jgi:release factor glutamine methyltransferase
MNTKRISWPSSVKNEPGLHLRTVARALDGAAHRLAETSETARLDAEVLLAHVLNKDGAYLRAWPERCLEEAETQSLEALIERRADGIPVAYLTGKREFWSREFRVTPAVLIPRPETELLVELALSLLPLNESRSVLDLGTGSGAIAVTLAAERPLARIIAVDISDAALQIARGNAGRHGVQNIRFVKSDWFASVPVTDRFDLILSNPPYIAENDEHLSQGDVRFEPGIALKSGPLGLNALSIIADQARRRVRAAGHLLLEHGFNQATPVKTVLTRLGYTGVTHHRDLQGHLRVTSATAPSIAAPYAAQRPQ